MLINILFMLLVWISYEIDVWLDWKKITFKKESPLHGLEAAIIAGIYAILAFLFYGFAMRAIAIFCLILAIRWLYFDFRINQRLGRKWNALGKTAMLDKLLRKLPNAEYTQYIIKFSLIIITILLICIPNF